MKHLPFLVLFAAVARAQTVEPVPAVVVALPLGIELVLFALGFLCGAVAWRMFVGRW